MKAALLAALLLVAATHAQAVDGVGLVYGRGNNVDVLALEASSAEWRSWPRGNGDRVSLYGIGSIAYWHAREPTEHKQLWDLGFAPVVRLERPRGSGATAFLEASFGVHLLSKRRINGHRAFGTSFQFGEFVGAGLLFGARRQLGLGVRLQHVSNGGIRDPNPGLTFVSIVGRYEL